MALLREISRRDPAAFSARARARLRDFAERPRRVVHPGYYDEIRQDEALRAALRGFLRDLGDLAAFLDTAAGIEERIALQQWLRPAEL